MKRVLAYLLSFGVFICCPHSYSQDNPVMHYLQKASEYAEIYNGKMETPYNPAIYENLPYFMNDDYTETAITYRKNSYPGQRARLDLYREQLILMLPEKRYGIIVDPRYVDKVTMYNKSFIWLTPPKDSKLKAGYYILSLEGENIQLLCKEIITTNSKNESHNVISYFIRKQRFYVACNDRYYQVKKAGSFAKIFPEHKRQINMFTRYNGLNFRQYKEDSMAVLAGYCDELITSNDKQ